MLFASITLKCMRTDRAKAATNKPQRIIDMSCRFELIVVRQFYLNHESSRLLAGAMPVGWEAVKLLRPFNFHSNIFRN